MTVSILRDLDSSVWNTTNPSTCPCQGNGWLCSDYDTWHKCCAHHRGQPHPEYDGVEDTFDYDAAHLANYREAYRVFGRLSGLTSMEMIREALKVMDFSQGKSPTPAMWVNAAERVARDIEDIRLQEEAKASGYSCALEARWDAEAAVEAGARARNMDPEVYAPYGSPERADADRWYPVR